MVVVEAQAPTLVESLPKPTARIEAGRGPMYLIPYPTHLAPSHLFRLLIAEAQASAAIPRPCRLSETKTVPASKIRGQQSQIGLRSAEGLGELDVNLGDPERAPLKSMLPNKPDFPDASSRARGP